ncbi:MAG: hypothetical protein HZA93_23410 [Verrucomicrobia bacterium]|nr:hypothetical protein [Verrucomicrobiota bacterium]
MITLRSAELLRLDLRLRLPFRYGIVTLTEVPQIVARIEFDLGGRIATGLAADILAPKWFTKDPARAIPDEIEEMLRVIRAAVRHATAVRAPTAFAFWRELYAAQAAWGAANGLAPLLAHFGTSFVERALLHALCRVNETTLSKALRGGLAGIEAGAVHAGLRGVAPADFLPAVPSPAVFARHTIGLGDPIEAGEVAPSDRPDDGLPVALDEAIRAYGLRHFKIKINGEAARDRDRLARIASVLARENVDFAFSLDGNETWKDVASFRDYFLGLRAEPPLAALWPRLLYVEQPWHRAVALSPAIGELARTWPDRPPIIIDESDGEIDSAANALALGYAGTSHKNCKGVFKSVLNAGLLAQARAAGRTTVLSGEDLCSVGPLSPLPDLAAAAALGITSVERNGQHYYSGLAQFPAALQEHALRHHPDIYVRSERGWPRIEIRDGQLALGSVNAAPFGLPGDPDLSALAVERVV